MQDPQRQTPITHGAIDRASMPPTRHVIIIHAQPTSSPPKPTASSFRRGVMRNIISNGKSAGGARLLRYNIGTTAAPTPSRKQPRDTEGGFHARPTRQFSRAG